MNICEVLQFTVIVLVHSQQLTRSGQGFTKSQGKKKNACIKNNVLRLRYS